MSQLTINPFDDLIVKEPRQREPVVPGLNEAPLKALVHEIEHLLEGPLPRPNRRLGQAQRVTSAQPGLGKSHLIGRLFRELHGRATLVYVQPFQNSTTVFQSLMIAVTREMHFPDRADAGAWNREEATQFDHLGHGILAHLLADLVESGRDVKTEAGEREQIAARLRGDPLGAFNRGRANESNWADWMRQQFPRLLPLFEEAMASRGLGLTAPAAWLKVLFAYAFAPFDTALRRAALDWMVANPLEDEALALLGLRPRDGVPAELEPAEANQISRSRLTDLCQLAVFYRPFLFCFDQTEVYGHHAALARSFGLVLGRLVDEASNHLTVVTSNQDPWTERIAPNFERADLERLSPSPLALAGLDRNQAETLARLRMAAIETDEGKVESFFARGWLPAIFESGRMGTRQFLQKCKERWGNAPDSQPLPLSDLYRQHREKILASPKRHQFEPDTLKWVIEDAARSLEGVKMEPIEEKYFSIKWETPQRHCYFGFVGGAHWKQWRAIAQAAVAKCRGDARPAKAVFFRTPEQQPVPNPAWAIAGEIEAAKSQYLQLICLSIEDLSELYAAKEIFADAAQGDIAFGTDQVLAFLQEQLAPWWRRFSGAHDGGAPHHPTSSEPGGEDKCSPEELRRRVREIVERARFLSVEDVSAQLDGGKVTAEEVLTACGFSPEIRIHTHPNMTVLQWQTG